MYTYLIRIRWGHLLWNEKRGCHFLGIQSTAIHKCQNQYRYRTGFQNFVRTLRYMLQHHGCSSKPKHGLSLKEVVWPALCAPSCPAGCWQAGESLVGASVAPQAHGRPVLLPQGCDGSPTSSLTPAPAQPLRNVRGQLKPPCTSRCPAAAFGYCWRGLSLGQSLLPTSYRAEFPITLLSVSLTVRL